MMERLLPQFDLDNDSAYQQWREQKLLDYPTTIEQLIIEIRDPARLSAVERGAMLQRMRKTKKLIEVKESGPNRADNNRLIALAPGAVDVNSGIQYGTDLSGR
jgi:hypothetical protein